MNTPMKCEECRDALDALVDGELLPHEAERIRNHLAGCGACAAEHQMLTRLSDFVQREAPRPRAPDVLKARIRSELARPGSVDHAAPASSTTKWRLVAAGAVIALLSGTGAYIA